MVWLLLCFVVSLCVFLFASLLYLYQRPAFVVPPVGIHPLKEPSTYDGADPSKFKAWIFDVEEALSARRLSPDREVAFAASYLQGNAKLWFVNVHEQGNRPANWFKLKARLSTAFGPAHVQERSRILLLRTTQTGDLESYVSSFSGLALMTTDLDDHTKAIIFTKGLVPYLQKSVLQQHPETLQNAVRAARCAQEVAKSDDSPNSNAPMFAAVRTDFRRPLVRLTPEERERLAREGRCFRCRRSGHFARNCQGPNANRQ